MAVVLGMVRGASAQPAEVQAEALFRRGKELISAGKVAEACDAFDASQALDPRLTTLLNQANCRERNDQLATAWGLYVEAARQSRAATGKSSQQMHAVATERARKLEARLSTLRVVLPGDSRIEGLEVLRDGKPLDPATWNQALPIDGGTYKLSARAAGHEEWSTTITVAVELEAKTVEVPRLRSVVSTSGQERVERSNVIAPVRPLPPAEPDSVWSTRRRAAVITAAGGLLALGAGAALGVSAKRKQRDAHALCADPQIACDDADRANQLIESGHERAIAANVAFAVTAAAAITSGVLWFTGAPEPSRPVVVMTAATPGQIIIGASGSF